MRQQKFGSRLFSAEAGGHKRSHGRNKQLVI